MRWISIALFLFLGIQYAWAQPQIQVIEVDYNFGSVHAGEKVEHVFKFKNEGSANLEIEELVSSCSCTAAELSKKLYKPGETGEIAVTLDTKKLSGAVTKSLKIGSNDPVNPDTRVILKGKVIREISTNPRFVFMAKASYGELTAQKVIMTRNTSGKLTISKVTTEAAYITATFERIDDQNYAINIVADGNKYPTDKMRLISSVTAVFDNGEEKKIPVTVNIIPAIRVSPKGVYFFATKKGQDREVNVKLLSDDTFEITKIESDLDYVKVAKENNKSLLVTLKSGTIVPLKTEHF